MKVGTDGVLLGAWTQPNKAQNILDIGCGTGLISLMLAQKTDASVLALEIDKNDKSFGHGRIRSIKLWKQNKNDKSFVQWPY